jgi:hypothetical protein
MRFGVAPGDELAVVPDPTVAIVKCLGRHGALLGLAG